MMGGFFADPANFDLPNSTGDINAVASRCCSQSTAIIAQPIE